LFLGSPFAQKMLNIKLEEASSKAKDTKQNKNPLEDGWDSEELKGDSGSFIIDTSDVSSSDGGEK